MLIEKLTAILNDSGEMLDFSLSKMNDEKVRLVVTLRLPKLGAGAHGYESGIKELKDGYERVRSLLVKPILFEGTCEEVESELEAFVSGGRADDLKLAAAEAKRLSEQVKKLVEEAKAEAEKAKSKNSKKSSKSAKNSSCSSGGCGASKKSAKAEKTDKVADKAGEKEKQSPPEPAIEDMFA